MEILNRVQEREVVTEEAYTRVMFSYYSKGEENRFGLFTLQ